MQEIPSKENASEKKIELTLLSLLSRREHTEKELQQKLLQKGYDKNAIQKVLTQYVEKNLINPARFIESFIYSRVNKGYGPLRIRMELVERGLKEEFIEDHLNMTDNAWLNAIRGVWQKRFKGVVPQNFKQKAQQMRFLHYRGFTPEQIQTLFNANDE